MRGGPRGFDPGCTCPDLLRYISGRPQRFRLRDFYPLWCAVPRASTNVRLCNSRRTGYGPEETPYNPRHATHTRLHMPGLGYFLFRSPLLKESRLSFFSSGYSDVSFPRVPSACPMCSGMGNRPLRLLGSPIRRSVLQSPLAAPHGLSQLATSFIGFRCQGIRHTPLIS